MVHIDPYRRPLIADLNCQFENKDGVILSLSMASTKDLAEDKKTISVHSNSGWC